MRPPVEWIGRQAGIPVDPTVVMALVLAVFMAGCMRTYVDEPPAPEEDPLRDLAWLAGTWAGEAAGRQIVENWSGPHRGILQGVHRRVDDDGDGETVQRVHLRIEARGEITELLRSPGGRARPDRFARADRSEHAVIFEREAAAYPQRIMYQRQGEQRIAVFYEGVVEDVPHVEQFELQLIDAAP